MTGTWLWQGYSPTFLLRSVFLAAESAHISLLRDNLVYTKYVFGCWLMFLFIIAKKSRLFISTTMFNIYLPPFVFLSSPLARASPGTKSSGKTLSKYLTIICSHLIILEKIYWSYHLKDLHCRFFLSSFREDTSPKLPRSCPILNLMCL